MSWCWQTTTKYEIMSVRVFEPRLCERVSVRFLTKRRTHWTLYTEMCCYMGKFFSIYEVSLGRAWKSKTATSLYTGNLKFVIFMWQLVKCICRKLHGKNSRKSPVYLFFLYKICILQCTLQFHNRGNHVYTNINMHSFWEGNIE